MTPELENKINQYYALSWSDSQKTDIASTLICDLIEELKKSEQPSKPITE